MGGVGEGSVSVETAPQTLDLAALDDAMFDRLYADRIGPCFREHEGARIAAVATFKQRGLIAAGGVLGVAIVGGLVFSDAGVGLVIGFMAAIVAGIWAYQPLAQVGEKVKQAYCSAIAESMGAVFVMGSFGPPAFDRIKELRLVPGFARSKFEDCFKGTYKECSFDLYEAHLEQRTTDSKGRTRYSTVFRGQLVRMHFPRNFLGVTIVRRDAGVFNAFGGGEGLKKVGLEDPKFEKAFEVWGSDQVEARYLLHPVLMQRLLDLETVLKGKRLRCAFEGGELLVAVEGGNLFEPGDLFKTFDDPARARRIVDDIAGVVRVMDQVLGAQALRR
ncbi:possible Galanin [alpha proteobacterium U9-1i]|nr:possible Galanin [alpha proteobacterium U9-1i]